MMFIGLDDFDDYYEDEEADVNDVIRFWRVEGQARRYGFLLANFTHTTWARSRAEAEDNVREREPELVSFTDVYPVN